MCQTCRGIKHKVAVVRTTVMHGSRHSLQYFAGSRLVVKSADPTHGLFFRRQKYSKMLRLIVYTSDLFNRSNIYVNTTLNMNVATMKSFSLIHRISMAWGSCFESNSLEGWVASKKYEPWNLNERYINVILSQLMPDQTFFDISLNYNRIRV